MPQEPRTTSGPISGRSGKLTGALRSTKSLDQGRDRPSTGDPVTLPLVGRLLSGVLRLVND